MPLSPPDGAPREKIMIYGDTKVGKTWAWLSIARMYQQTKTPGTFYCIDSDETMDRYLFAEDLPNVKVWDATQYTEYLTAVDEILPAAKKGDWIICDMADRIYEAAYAYALEQSAQKRIGEARLEKDAERYEAGKWGNQYALKSFEDTPWQTIRELHHDVVKPLVLKRTPAHLFLVCEAKAVWSGGKPTDEVVPAGQKDLQHKMSTILRLKSMASGKRRTMSTQGDYGRDALKDEDYKDFCLSYLCKVAGWKVTS